LGVEEVHQGGAAAGYVNTTDGT
jgi:dolichyldiphosphatase